MTLDERFAAIAATRPPCTLTDEQRKRPMAAAFEAAARVDEWSRSFPRDAYLFRLALPALKTERRSQDGS